MNRSFPLMLVLSATLAATVTSQARVRVACLGDSITLGAGIRDREHMSYPAQLAFRLGDGFAVRNFGVGSRTLLRASDAPYMQTRQFREALAWRPDIAIVVLGTNDTCQSAERPLWEKHAALEEDAAALCKALRKVNGAVHVLLCTPPPMFPTRAQSPGRRKALVMRAARLATIAAALARAAKANAVRFVPLARALRPSDVRDGVHPNAFGAERMANLFTALLTTPIDTVCDLGAALRAAKIDVHPTDFHGFRQLDFRLPKLGAACKLVVPAAAAYDRPWIWRARFFGHQPALDLALLDRGFHVFYCDVAGLFGAPPAMARYDEAYALLRDFGLHSQPVLEGMSRGGLPVLNWASAHPGSVAAVYVDNPVCDFRSWPGGQHGKRSDQDWKRCLEVYGLDEASAQSYDRMPLDRVSHLAKLGVPLFAVAGRADKVVPPMENILPLVARYEDLGAPVHLWSKPGQGHHPHGLHPVAPLLRAILRACGRPANPAVRPVPNVEYRGQAAGWGGGTWWRQWESVRDLVRANPKLELVFLGDSVTQSLTGVQDRLAHEGGGRAIDRAFGSRRTAALGLSGDRTEHLLWRIQQGELAAVQPDVFVITIGINNLNARQHTATETAAGIGAIVAALRAEKPDAHLLLLGPLAGGLTIDAPLRIEFDDLHARIAKLADGTHVFYRDLRELFVDDDGKPNDRVQPDGIHLTDAGLAAWMDDIRPWVLEHIGS